MSVSISKEGKKSVARVPEHISITGDVKAIEKRAWIVSGESYRQFTEVLGRKEKDRESLMNDVCNQTSFRGSNAA